MKSNAVIIFAAKWILNLSQRAAKSKGNALQLIHNTYWRASAAQHSTRAGAESRKSKTTLRPQMTWQTNNGKFWHQIQNIWQNMSHKKPTLCFHRFIREQEKKFFMISAHRIVGCLQHQPKKLKRWKWNATKSMTQVQKGMQLRDERTVKEVIRKSGKRLSLKI